MIDRLVGRVPDEWTGHMTARWMARGRGRVLAPLRRLPNLLIIGAIRGGSTSLHDALIRAGWVAPSMVRGRKREMHYFDRDQARSVNWYRSWFPLFGARRFESTPAYLCTPGTARRAEAVLPDCRAVAVLRHPAERATSHFEWRRSRGTEQQATLVDALADEAARLERHDWTACYGLHSRYEVGLSQWFDALGRDQVLVLIAERLQSGDDSEIDLACRFLDIDRASFVLPHSNRGPHRHGAAIGVEGMFDETVAAVEALIGRSSGWRGMAT